MNGYIILTTTIVVLLVMFVAVVFIRRTQNTTDPDVDRSRFLRDLSNRNPADKSVTLFFFSDEACATCVNAKAEWTKFKTIYSGTGKTIKGYMINTVEHHNLSEEVPSVFHKFTNRVVVPEVVLCTSGTGDGEFVIYRANVYTCEEFIKFIEFILQDGLDDTRARGAVEENV